MSYEVDKLLEGAANQIRREFCNVSAPRTAIDCQNVAQAAPFSEKGSGSVGQTYRYSQLKL